MHLLDVQQELEQLEFARLQVDLLTSAPDLSLEQVNLEIGERQRCFVLAAGRSGSSDQRLESCQQLAEGERLHEIVVAAGLQRINISLDSLRPERFAELTRRDDLDRVLDGIDAALEAGLDPVKLNAVVMRGVNDDELIDFAAFGRDTGGTGEGFEVRPSGSKALGRGVNLVKRHQKQTQAQEGGIITKEAPIHLSNIALVGKDGKPTRVGFKIQKDGTKVRVEKRSGAEING